MRYRVSEVGPPLTEVVVDIEARYACGRGPALQGSQPHSHGLRLSHEGAGALEIEIIDDVDKEKRRSSGR